MRSPFHVGNAPVFIAAVDLDEDAVLDLVVVEYGDDAISVHHGNGDGTFAPGSRHDVLDAPDVAAVAGFDDDGHSDLTFVDYLDDTLTILLWNDGYACR